jgi:sulfate permease, SulP family
VKKASLFGSKEEEMAATSQKRGFRLPILQGVLPLAPGRVPLDIVAGITLAALAIPEVMGYTKIAGMPVITGLYTILIPMTLFAIFGSSRHLVVGADSATAAIMAGGLVGLAAAESPQYVALAGLLAIITGLIVLIARVIRLGFLADFLSRTVLIGFLTGVGIQVAIGQISGMLGIPGGGSGSIQKLVNDVEQLPQTNPLTLAISLVTIALIVGMKRITKKIPGALVAVIGMIVLSYVFDFQAKGVSVLGTVQGGLPQFGWPQVTLSASLLETLLPVAFSLFVVILAQSAATSRAYAAKYDERFSENTDLVGLTLANVSAGLSGTFVVNGSPTKTQMVDGAGGHSQLAQLTTSVIVLIVLLFLTGPLAYMPNAVLAAVVFVIGIELVDALGMRRIYTRRKDEFVVALITAVVVVFIGVEQAIILAIVLSLLDHVRRGYRPRNNVIVIEASGHLQPVPVANAQQVLPGLLIYRFNHNMYYANAERLSEEVGDLIKVGPAAIKWFCIDGQAVSDVDYSSGATLQQIHGELVAHGARLLFANLNDAVRAELDRYGITDLVGKDGYYESLANVLAAYRQQNTMVSPVDRS